MQGIYFISQKSDENEEEGCKVFVISRKCDIQMSDMICLLLACGKIKTKGLTVNRSAALKAQ